MTQSTWCFLNLMLKLYSKIVEDVERYILDASAYGEEFNPSKHERRSEVKAVTYHMMDIKIENMNIILQVILDI